MLVTSEPCLSVTSALCEPVTNIPKVFPPGSLPSYPLPEPVGFGRMMFASMLPYRSPLMIIWRTQPSSSQSTSRGWPVCMMIGGASVTQFTRTSACTSRGWRTSFASSASQTRVVSPQRD